MIDKNKLLAGVLFAASVGTAVKSVMDIRALRKEEKEIMSALRENAEAAMNDDVPFEEEASR